MVNTQDFRYGEDVNIVAGLGDSDGDCVVFTGVSIEHASRHAPRVLEA